MNAVEEFVSLQADVAPSRVILTLQRRSLGNWESEIEFREVTGVSRFFTETGVTPSTTIKRAIARVREVIG